MHINVKPQVIQETSLLTTSGKAARILQSSKKVPLHCWLERRAKPSKIIVYNAKRRFGKWDVLFIYLFIYLTIQFQRFTAYRIASLMTQWRYLKREMSAAAAGAVTVCSSCRMTSMISARRRRWTSGLFASRCTRKQYVLAVCQTALHSRLRCL